ncbi:hypothetical protein GCM10007391_01170 [Alteromonas halophila]|uniref:Uncharacterized protein n=1 Tax=Alteromonas halophila TaxID=516698 RepID=A0A918JD68_9ALTE|nr:hypothetical protein GCM10007391_01170 [Alteromonas halophila]
MRLRAELVAIVLTMTCLTHDPDGLANYAQHSDKQRRHSVDDFGTIAVRHTLLTGPLHFSFLIVQAGDEVGTLLAAGFG